MRWERFWKSVIDLFFPRRCIICGRQLLLCERHLCIDCFAELPLTYFWSYRENPAELRLTGRARVERVCSLFYYGGEYREILYSLKYRSNIRLARFMGELLGRKMRECSLSFDYIIPVPLHFLKRWKRGYNQAYIISCGLRTGLECGTVVTNILKRRRFTGTQTKREKIERWLNVREAFALSRSSGRRAAMIKRLLHGKRVLLVDDVLTTGATLDACCQLLIPLGAEITIATLAYVE